jgi:ABC-type branched-subunit amino acid transport system substrate-binding protein
MFVAAAIFGGTKEMTMTRLSAQLLSGLIFATFAFNTVPVHVQGTVRIGALLPMTGPSQSVGAQITAAIRLYMAQHGDVVAGKKIQVIVKDVVLSLTQRSGWRRN